MNRLLTAAALLTVSSVAYAQSLEGSKRARMTMNMFGCTDRDTFRTVTDLLVQSDKAAAAVRDLGRLMDARQCTMLKKDDLVAVEDTTKVAIEDTTLLAEVTCVRPQGAPSCFWTMADGVGREPGRSGKKAMRANP
jgi:hypothetical protein